MPTTRTVATRRAALVLLVCLVVSGGCRTSARGTPRSRLGALPFPGMFTLYRPADPDRLGRHRYARHKPLFSKDETSRGIIYTTRGGFVDVAHVRMTIDWTRYCTTKVRSALSKRQTALALDGTNHSVFHLTFHYPPDWDALPDDDRKRLVDELALRSGQRLGYLMLTWHELISWFGHRTVAVADERPSAFTYDDVGSHALGVRVAARALRDGKHEKWDDAVTAALRAELRELGAVAPRRTNEAARAVEGSWWDDGRPLKRQLDETLAGIADGAYTVRPWLVPHPSFAAGAEPTQFTIPSLSDVMGRDFSGLYTLEIAPRIEQGRAMRMQLAGRPVRFSADRDIPALLQAVRAQMREQFTADFDRPVPAVAATDEPPAALAPPAR